MSRIIFRGRKERTIMILVISSNGKSARALSDMLYHMGVLSFGIDENSFSDKNLNYLKAAVFLEPELLIKKREIAENIKAAKKDAVRLFVGSTEPTDENLFDAKLERGAFAAEIYELLSNEARKKGLCPPGKYGVGDFQADSKLPSTIYREAPLPFSKTENMILRAVICAYPEPISAKDILRYAFRNSRLPEISNVRTHICIMNKKFRALFEKPLCELISPLGYRLADT